MSVCRVVVENTVALMSGAFYDKRFDALFTNDIIANVLGATEFNSIGITVESPLEDYFDDFKSKVTSSKSQQALSTKDNAARKAALRIYSDFLNSDADVPCDVRRPAHQCSNSKD